MRHVRRVRLGRPAYAHSQRRHAHAQQPPQPPTLRAPPALRARRASRPTRRLRADTDDASVEQLALMREEVDRPNLVSGWPAAPHPRSTVHDAVLRNRRARHPDERHTVACELRWRANSGGVRTHAQTPVPDAGASRC
eukprot:743330-Prymnesium_polylepis.1